MKYLSQLTKDQIEDKKCLLRINLDIKDPSKDSLRIDASLPTIKFLLEGGAKILILSHRGRPERPDSKLSLEPLIKILQTKTDLTFRSPTSVGSQTSLNLSWLENLRFDPREQQNDDGFAQELASKGHFFVNDDFAVSHRANASVMAITKHLPSYAGLRLEKEIKILSGAVNNPQRPLVLIIGGAKIDDKIGVIENFRSKADHILTGSSYIDLLKSNFQGKFDFAKIIIPEDWTGEDGRKLDIGSKTIDKYTNIISQAKTVVWNGPMGMFENPKYLNGSQKIAEAIISSGAFSIIGGGDTQQLLNQLGIEDKFSFISTGGGAMLEFLAGKKLPALEVLGYYS